PDLIDPTCDPDVDPWCQIIVDPEPTEPPTGGPDPYPTPEFTWPSDGWQTYFDAVTKAQNDYQDYVASAQKDFEIATADAAATRDAAIANASSFADVVEAVKNFRLATADQKAKLDQVLSDANEALNLVIKNAWDTLVSSGGGTEPIFWCGVKSGGQTFFGLPPADHSAEPKHDKQHNKSRR
ncbi:MAG: hypothetical protein KGQ38_07325, partial [Actinomycetales bacterium]|nr:hypothetical protein [Actinomycetales bacterium]